MTQSPREVLQEAIQGVDEDGFFSAADTCRLKRAVVSLTGSEDDHPLDHPSEVFGPW